MAKKKTVPVIKTKLDEKPVPVQVKRPVLLAKKPAAVPVQPSEVSLGSLNMKDIFELKGERYRIAEKAEDFVVTNKMEIRYVDDKAMWLVVGTFTFGTGTMVKKI